MHKVPKVVPDHFRSGSLILDQSNKDLIRNQGTIFFSHKILEDIGGKVPSFLISLHGSLILDQSYKGSHQESGNHG